jgi:hypothetical protein
MFSLFPNLKTEILAKLVIRWGGGGGAMTLSITTFTIMTLSITTFTIMASVSDEGKKFYSSETSGLYYKNFTIVIYSSACSVPYDCNLRS